MSCFISKDLILILESLKLISQSLFRLLSFLYLTVQSGWKNYCNFLVSTTKSPAQPNSLYFTVKFLHDEKQMSLHQFHCQFFLNFHIQNQFPRPKTQLGTRAEFESTFLMKSQAWTSKHEHPSIAESLSNVQEMAFELNLCELY